MTHRTDIVNDAARNDSSTDRPEDAFGATLAAQIFQHTIKPGETASEIAAAYGYTLEQLEKMNPSLREDPAAIRAGNTLTIFTPSLFERVETALETSSEATTAHESYESMTSGRDEGSAYPRSKLYAAEAPSVLQNANRKEGEVVDILVAEFLEVGLPAALDDESLNAVFDTYADAFNGMGEGEPGFAALVEQAKSEARTEIDNIFGREIEITDAATGDRRTTTLRDLMEAAEGTAPESRRQTASPEWQNVRAGIETLMNDLGQENVDAAGGDGENSDLIRARTVQDLAVILGSATPNSDLAPENDPYLTAVNGAAEEILILQPLGELNERANDEEAAREADDTVPVLTLLVEQTDGIPPELAAQRIEASDSHVRDALLELFGDSLDGTVAHPGRDQVAKIFDAMASLGTLTDRAYAAPGGEAAIQELASAIVTVLLRAGGDSRETSEILAAQVATGLEKAIGEGASTVLAEEIARQLMDPEVTGEGGPYDTEASIILERAATGVETLRENADSAGTEYYDEIILPSELGRQNLENSSTFSHQAGVNALLEDNQDLIERGNRYGEGIILTLASGADGLPPGLQGLDGAQRLQDARSDLESSVNQEVTTADEDGNVEINPIPILMQSSPGAAIAGQRVANAEALEALQTVPREDLERLIQEASDLPEDDPYSGLAARLTATEDPVAVLYESPELTLTLLSRFSETDPAVTEAPEAPNAGFMSRAGRDAIAEVFAFQTQAGGVILQPSERTRMFATLATASRMLRGIGGDIRSLQSYVDGWGDPNRPLPTSEHSRLRQVASHVLFGNKPIEARSGIPSRAGASSAWNLGSAILNGWAVHDLLLQPGPGINKAWGVFFGTGAVMDVARILDAGRGAWTGRPGFAQISGLRGWEWLPRAFNGFGATLAVLQVGYEIGRGDMPMAAAWTPGAAASLYAATPGAAAGGPVLAAGFLITSTLVTAISQHRRVEASNVLEGPLGTYLEAAAPDVDKPESLANSDSQGNPYLALNPRIAEAQGVTPEAMVAWLYSLDKGERDTFIEQAHGVKPDDNGEYPMRNPNGEPPTRPLPTRADPTPQIEVDTVQDLQYWARENGYVLPTA